MAAADTPLSGDELYSVARSLRKKWEGKRKFLIETSGGIDESNLKERAVNGTPAEGSLFLRADHWRFADIDILSTSAVHQSVQHIDFSLKIQMN